MRVIRLLEPDPLFLVDEALNLSPTAPLCYFSAVKSEMASLWMSDTSAVSFDKPVFLF